MPPIATPTSIDVTTAAVTTAAGAGARAAGGGAGRPSAALEADPAGLDVTARRLLCDADILTAVGDRAGLGGAAAGRQAGEGCRYSTVTAVP